MSKGAVTSGRDPSTRPRGEDLRWHRVRLTVRFCAEPAGAPFDTIAQDAEIRVLEMVGRVEVPQEAFVAALSTSEAPGSGKGESTRQRKRRSRRLLVTTKTLEKAIAAPASIGLSRPAAASGIAATL